MSAFGGRIATAFVDIRANTAPLRAGLRGAVADTERSSRRMAASLRRGRGRGSGLRGFGRGLSGGLVAGGGLGAGLLLGRVAGRFARDVLAASASGQELTAAFSEGRQAFVELNAAVLDLVGGPLRGLAEQLRRLTFTYRIITGIFQGKGFGIAVGDAVQRQVFGGTVAEDAKNRPIRGIVGAIETAIGSFKTGQQTPEQTTAAASVETANAQRRTEGHTNATANRGKEIKRDTKNMVDQQREMVRLLGVLANLPIPVT